MNPTRIEVKQVLRRSPVADYYFGNRYSFSPYRACAHGCLYCDGRAEKYYVEGDFGSDIVIRGNLNERLEKELPLLREKGYILAGSGVTDAYQPIEAKEGLMTRALELIHQKGFPAIVLTKSVLPGRDLELIKKINTKAGFILLVTLCTLCEEERKIFEPGASSVGERLALLEKARAAGIPTGICAMPLLPLLWDTEERLAELFTALKSRTDYILPASLTLRPGIQKETYMEALTAFRPDLTEQYQRLYSENRPSGAPLTSYTKELYSRIYRRLQEEEIPHQMPHRIYREKISLVDEIHILLKHLEQLYSPRGIDTRPVREAEKRYTAWLAPLRKEFNRKRSLPPDWLGHRLQELAVSRRLGPLLGNRKLENFMEKVILEPVEFDYMSLKLIEASPRRKKRPAPSDLNFI